MKAWPTPVVISRGDYSSPMEACLEKHIGGNLYSQQPNLPPLPVPPLGATLTMLHASAKALSTSEQMFESFESALDKFKSSGEAQRLHARLLSRAEAAEVHKTSWLQLWWNQLGYLSVRDPVPVNVSYFFQFRDDPTTQQDGVKRGAAALVATALFRYRCASGSLPCEQIGRKVKTPLCSTAFKYLFNACRIPGVEIDTYNIYDPSRNHHVVVCRRGIFFSFDFVDPATGKPKPLAVLEALLTKCKEIADSSIATAAFKVGVLTANERTQWGRDRAEIMRYDSMKVALETIQSSAILLCLDSTDTLSRGCTSEVFWHGGGELGGAAANRFFDKSIQIFATDNGKCGMLGEHSMMDGMPVLQFANYVTKITYAEAGRLAPPADQDDEAVDEKVAVLFYFDENIPDVESKFDALIARGTASYNNLVNNQELTVECFRGFGASFIKRNKFSPDSFFQMVIQLASYRLFGEFVATYEASQVRAYRHGRTETTRSCSIESAEWVVEQGRFNDNNNFGELGKRRIEMLRKAAESHGRFVRLAAKGQGVDRVLFGLRMLVGEREEVPALFNNELFLKSKRWRVSTSHLTHPDIDNWGWGEVVEDGVGVAYSIHAERIVFNVTSVKKTNFSKRFCHLLSEALVEIGDMLLEKRSRL